MSLSVLSIHVCGHFSPESTDRKTSAWKFRHGFVAPEIASSAIGDVFERFPSSAAHNFRRRHTSLGRRYNNDWHLRERKIHLALWWRGAASKMPSAFASFVFRAHFGQSRFRDVTFHSEISISIQWQALSTFHEFSVTRKERWHRCLPP